MAHPPFGSGPRPFPGSPQDLRARDQERRTDQRRQEQVADTCGDLEESLEQLRARYELYFLGVERREPTRDRDEMKRSVARLRSETMLNTGLRFRIDTLHARFVAYERMWMRTAREKEEGTYRRDLQRLRRKTRVGGAEGTSPAEQPATRPGAVASKPASTPTPTPAPVAAAPQPPPPPSAPSAGAGGLSAEQLQTLYVAYVDARKRCNEDVSRITYEALAKTVSRQVPELLARYKAKSVEFRVVIKDGHALLKAVPRT